MRSARERVLPLIVVLAATLVIWYGAAILLNLDLARNLADENASAWDILAATLQQDGFKVRRTGTTGRAPGQTVIRYHAGQEAEALLLAKNVHGAALDELSGPARALGSGYITLMLGPDYGTTVTTASAASPQPASTFAPRTASQNICT